MIRLRWAFATFAVLGAACGYGGGATGDDAGGGPTSDASGVDASRADGSADAGILLTVTSSPPVAQVSLDAEGTLGWIHWANVNGNRNGYVTKAAAPIAIPPFMVPSNNDLTTLSDWGAMFQWSNGAPQFTGNDRNGVSMKSPYPPSFTMTLPATSQARRLVLYVGVFSGTAQLTVTLGGQAAGPIMPLDTTNNGYIRYAIDFSSAAAENLDIAWTLTNSHSNVDANVTFSAATLSVTP